MNFIVLKCHVIAITNNKSPVLFCYKMNGAPLECVTELLDLRIIVDLTLSWSPHNYKQNQSNDIIFCLNGKYEVDISKYVFFSKTALTIVPTARQMKDFS